MRVQLQIPSPAQKPYIPNNLWMLGMEEYNWNQIHDELTCQTFQQLCSLQKTWIIDSIFMGIKFNYLGHKWYFKIFKKYPEGHHIIFG